MTAPVRWGVLGAAGILGSMAPAIRDADGTQLTAIASRTTERAVDAAERYGAERAVHGYEALLADPGIDVVYVPLPNAFHREWVLAAAAAGKHVLCEKPLAITAADAREMVSACEAAGVLLAEGFMYAHHPRYDRIAEIVRSGAIGEVRSITTHFSFDASDELEHSGFQGLPGSGAVYDVGCYAIHSARHLLGREPLAVTAAAIPSRRHGDIDMATTGLVEFDGAQLIFHVDMAGADTDTIEVIGSAGRILVPHAFICDPGDGDFTVVIGDESHIETVPVVDHFRLEVERFSAAVRGTTGLRYDRDDPIRNAAALEAVSASWRENRRVTL